MFVFKDWSEEILICQDCADVLQTLYSFRNQCIKSSYLRNNKKELKEENSEQEKENADDILEQSWDINEASSCLLCGKNYNNTEHLQGSNCICEETTSKQIITSKDKRELLCFHCGEVFHSKLTICRHIRVKHGLRVQVKEDGQESESYKMSMMMVDCKSEPFEQAYSKSG